MKRVWFVLLFFCHQVSAQDTAYLAARKLGIASKAKKNYELAISYFNKELALAQQKKDVPNIVGAYKDLGVTYQDESKYPLAQENFFKALSLSENDKAHPLLCVILADIASTYTIENQTAKAKEYLQRALALNEQKDTLALTKVLELMGVIFKQTYEAQKFEKKGFDHLLMDSARYFYTKALDVYQAARNRVGEASMYMQIGSTYEDTYANDERSLDYCLKSKAIWDSVDPGNNYALYNMDNIANDYWAMAVTLDTMPYIRNRAALRRSLALKGEEYFKEALAQSRKSANNVSSLYALGNMSAVQAFVGKYKDAYESMREYSQMHDSTFSQENADKIVSMEAQHEVEIRNRQIEINKLEIADRKRFSIVLMIGLLLLLAVALLIYRQNRRRKRTNAELESLNKQLANANKINMQFFGILNHDLRRPVASVVTLLNLQKKDPSVLNEQNKEKYFGRITQSTEKLLTTMEDLLLWSKGQMENFKPQFTQVPVSELFTFIKDSLEGTNVDLSFEPATNDLVLHTDVH